MSGITERVGTGMRPFVTGNVLFVHVNPYSVVRGHSLSPSEAVKDLYADSAATAHFP